MKIRNRKFMVFVMNTVVLLLVLVGLFTLAKEHIPVLAQWVIIMFVANGAAYITGNTVDSHTKSKYYREELDDGDR